MDNSKQSKQVLLSVIGVAILVVAVVGVSFAFFNYTRTGAANTVTTGTIQFNSSQTQMNVNNAFPVSKDTAEAATTSSHANVAVATVTITGNTTYNDGLDFRVTAQGVDLNVAAANETPVNVPISVLVTTNGNLTEVNDAASSATGNSIFVQDFENGTLTNNAVLATGHINAETSANQTITIKAYMDKDKIAISDTPKGGAYDPEQAAETGYTDASNGTTTTWIGNRTRLTTTQWNRLASNPATFNIRVESRQTCGTYAY